MWILDSDRQTLIEILLGNGRESLKRVHEESHWPVEPVQEDKFYLLWETDTHPSNGLPSVIVVSKGHMRDFLAWAITYFASYRPFTAFFRVIEFDDLVNFDLQRGNPSLHGLEAACAGVILTEASLLSSTYGKSSALTLASCSGLLSHALTRSLALGATSTGLERIRDKWQQARKLADYKQVSDVTQTVAQIFGILLELKARICNESAFLFPDMSSTVTDACWQICHDGRVSDRHWKEIVAGCDSLSDAHRHMEGTREERVLYFQRIVADGITRLPKSTMADFVIGYMASLIGPGSLSHIDLIMKHISSFPTAALWYGLCAGLHKKNEILVSFNILGRRLIRDLLKQESLLNTPTCDIALSELQILQNITAETVQFPGLGPNRVLVEIDPCICVLLAWGKRTDERQTTAQPSLFSSSKDSAQLFKELETHLQTALAINKELFARGERSLTTYDKNLPKQKSKKYKPRT
jgi:hypothetical protein